MVEILRDMPEDVARKIGDGPTAVLAGPAAAYRAAELPKQIDECRYKHAHNICVTKE